MKSINAPCHDGLWCFYVVWENRSC